MPRARRRSRAADRPAPPSADGCARDRCRDTSPITSSRIGSAERTRCFSSSSSGAPAQWRSSSTSTSGRSCDAAARRPVTASNRRNRSVSASATCGAGRSGTRCGQLGHEAGELAAMRAARGAASTVVGRVRDVVPERLDEGPVREPDVLVAAAEEHRRRPRRARRAPPRSRAASCRSPARRRAARPGAAPSCAFAHASASASASALAAEHRERRPSAEPRRQRNARRPRAAPSRPHRPRPARAAPSARAARSARTCGRRARARARARCRRRGSARPRPPRRAAPPRPAACRADASPPTRRRPR